MRPHVLLVLLLAASCDKPATSSEFEDAEVFFELNTTANDLGLLDRVE